MDNALAQLNRLQAGWARFLQCHKRTARIDAFKAISQRGWIRRLGTLLLERAIMARARIQLLPREHPAVAMLHLADNIPAITWSSSLRTVLYDLCLVDQIPDITSRPDIFDADTLESARHCPKSRKETLRLYRDIVVRPVLETFDHGAYEAAVGHKTIFGIPFMTLQPCLVRTCPALLDLPNSTRLASWTRIWACIRCTGKWPLLLFTGEGFESTLPNCPLRNAPDASVQHLLTACMGTEPLHRQLINAIEIPQRPLTDAFLHTLFDWSALPKDRYYHIMFVGRALTMALSAESSSELRHTERDPIDILIEQARIAATIVAD